MPTHNGRDYHFGEASITTSSNPEISSIFMNPNILTILEDIKTQLNNLGQRMNIIENDRRDGDRQPSPRQEDRVPRNHDRHENDDRVPKEHQVGRVKFRRSFEPTILPRLGNESR